MHTYNKIWKKSRTRKAPFIASFESTPCFRLCFDLFLIWIYFAIHVISRFACIYDLLIQTFAFEYIYIYSLTKCKCFQTQRTPNEFHNHFCLYKICSAHIFTRDFDCDYKWNLRERKNNYESWQTQVTNAYKLRALLKMRQRVGFSKCELKNSFSWPVFALKRIHGNANYTFRARLN